MACKGCGGGTTGARINVQPPHTHLPADSGNSVRLTNGVIATYATPEAALAVAEAYGGEVLGGDNFGMKALPAEDEASIAAEAAALVAREAAAQAELDRIAAEDAAKAQADADAAAAAQAAADAQAAQDAADAQAAADAAATQAADAAAADAAAAAPDTKAAKSK
jgi:hypothetical protein